MLTVPSIGVVIGWMLGAKPISVYATSSGTDGGTPGHETLWIRDKYRYLAFADVRAVVCDQGRTREYLRGALEDDAPREADWLGWTDRLLTPRHLYIWGRPGEDWRLSGEVRLSEERPDAVTLPLVPTDGPRGKGSAVVHRETGTVLELKLGGRFEWRLDQWESNPHLLPPRPDPTEAPWSRA